MSLKKLTLSLVFLLATQVFSFAQNSLDSLQYLNEVTIFAEPFGDVIPTQSLSGEQLERLSSHNIADALRYFSGVQVKDYGGLGGLKTIDVRNMGTHHVGVFYDGIELGNMQNGIVDLGKFSLDDMESLTMYNGQKSDIFQSAKDFASASTVYLRSKKPRFVRSKRTNLVARYKIMDLNFNNPSFRLEQKLNDNINLSLSSEYVKSNGKYKFRYRRKNLDGTLAYDTTAIRQNSDIETLRIETGVYGKLDRGYWDAKLYYFDSDRGAPGAVVENHFSDGYRQKDKNFFGQAYLTKEITDNYKMQVRTKFAFDYMDYHARDTTDVLGETVTEGAQISNTYYQREAYLSTVHMYAISPIWDISASVDFQWNALNGVLRGIKTPFAHPTRYTTLGSLASSLSLGKFKAMGSVIGTYVNDKVEHGAKPDNKKEVTPALFLGYKPFDDHDFNLRAFTKRIFRMPTFNDLYYTQVGSSVLRPEYMNQYNVGFTYGKYFRSSFLDHVSIQADAYYTDTKDKIIAAPTGSLFRWMMTNIGKVKGRGIEAVANVKMHAGPVDFTANLTYAYTQSRDYTYVGGIALSSYGDQIPYTPWNSGSAILNANYDSWNFNYSFIYVGQRYNGGVNNIPKNKVEPWYTHDMSLQKKFVFNKVKTTGTVEVNNLFAQDYEVIYNFPMPMRTFRFIISLEI